MVAGTGFLSGSTAPGIARYSIPSRSLNEFTQVGASGSYGAYGPETLGRLGVSHSLRSDYIDRQTPENKFAALGIGYANTDTTRIASILGKSPDPLGQTPGDKIRRFTETSKQTPREKLKQFI